MKGKSRPPSDSVKRSSQSQRHIEADRINFSSKTTVQRSSSQRDNSFGDSLRFRPSVSSDSASAGTSICISFACNESPTGGT